MTTIPVSNVKYIIQGSSGILYVSETGKILDREKKGNYDDITSFNVIEFIEWARKALPAEDLHKVIELDILEIGYWWKNADGKVLYERPHDDFRENVIKANLKRKK